MRRSLPISLRHSTAGFVIILLFWPGAIRAQYGATQGEWWHYGGDAGSTKYSPLDQVTAANFSTLRMAWRWESADAQLVRTDASGSWRAPAERVFDMLERENPKRWLGYRGRSGRPTVAGFVATPLMVAGVLYIGTALNQAAAIDARTGKTLWVYDPKAYESGTPPPSSRPRGVAYWAGDGRAVARILWGTANGYLIAVDARTGRPIADFGRNGRVDLMEGLPRASRGSQDGRSAVSSPAPPLVIRDTVIVGSAINDFTETRETPPGWVRAYDVRTGRPKWHFNPIPEPGEFGNETWKNDSWAYTGSANMWSAMSGDEELGYVYLPLGSPTSDHYGGHRPGDGLFGDSLVCVDVATGKRVWHFQMIHHNMWDYDNVAAPNLVDISVGGRTVKAVVQINKPGFVYTFDRLTGVPVWPIEERQVPSESDLKGEAPSRTQPFPTKPPPVDYQGTSIEDLVDFTPEIRQKAIEAVQKFKLGPIYTPHSMRGTIMRPGVIGSVNWGGAAIDPQTGMLYVPSQQTNTIVTMREPRAEDATDLRYLGTQGPGPVLAEGVPLWKPPYGRVTAIDMNKGAPAWIVPDGNGDKIRQHPMLRDLDLPPVGGDGARAGPVLTKTLLVVPHTAGGTNNGPRLVAYDKTNGKEVGAVDLPDPPLGTPMTYMLEGKQYIALTVGGALPGLVVFSLP